ncbi:hypothetical protein [Pelomonas cellulosilytica]|uniref:hypothetical protein n=1 Tax=Pelomonas cellulosilytica TaxID=2906762 RepID=UPI001F3D5D01|nr:hypothetical protein [Pelomonas sp. P8]
MLSEIERHVQRRESFAFETTFSGRAFARSIERWNRAGYQIELFFVCLIGATHEKRQAPSANAVHRQVR